MEAAGSTVLLVAEVAPAEVGEVVVPRGVAAAAAVLLEVEVVGTRLLLAVGSGKAVLLPEVLGDSGVPTVPRILPDILASLVPVPVEHTHLLSAPSERGFVVSGRGYPMMLIPGRGCSTKGFGRIPMVPLLAVGIPECRGDVRGFGPVVRGVGARVRLWDSRLAYSRLRLLLRRYDTMVRGAL